MKNNILQQFVTLRNALHREKSDLESRLKEINEALGASVSAGGAPVRTASSKATVSRSRKGPRHMSAEAKAKISEAQRTRWAKIKGGNAKPSSASKAAGKGGMSEAQRAKISLAQKARWAKFRAAKGK